MLVLAMQFSRCLATSVPSEHRPNQNKPRIGEPNGASAWCVGAVHRRRQPVAGVEGSAPSQQKRGHAERLDPVTGSTPRPGAEARECDHLNRST